MKAAGRKLPGDSAQSKHVSEENRNESLPLSEDELVMVIS